MGKILLSAWWFSGRGNNMEEEDFEKFKQMTREEGIPEETTVNVTETGNRIILFPKRIIHLVCKYAIGKQVNLFKTSSSTSNLL